MAVKPTKQQVATAAGLMGEATSNEERGKAVISAVLNEDTPQAQSMSAAMADAGVVEIAGYDGDRALYAVPGDISNLRNFVFNYDPSYNPFVSTLLNRIFSTTVETLQFDNPWAQVKKGYVEYGDTLEETYIDPAGVHRYSPQVAETEVFKREKPTVHAAFHTLNAQIFHKTTLQQNDLKQAFLSYKAFGDFVAAQMRSLITAGEYDEWNLMKYLVGNAVLKGWITPVAIDALPTDADTAKAFLATLQAYSDNFALPNTMWNLAGVMNKADISEQVFIQTNAQHATVNVQALAALFNEEYANYRTGRLALDEFSNIDWDRMQAIMTNPDTGAVDSGYAKWTSTQTGYLDNLAGILMSRRWFQVWDNFEDSGSIYNPQGLYWNYVHHMWRTVSFSPVQQAVAFMTNPGTATTVTVSPNALTLAPGGRGAFTAAVTGASGVVSQDVDWSLTGATDPNTSIVDGVLVLGPKEAGTTNSVTVTATARGTETSGTATVTVS